mmetsp:Transcript_20472/g.56809  ORF Transcript_20472/g.56809 Transcript_20472/m.56809 type:complete len:423 (-) Transcript_20472:7-1275(-)
MDVAQRPFGWLPFDLECFTSFAASSEICTTSSLVGANAKQMGFAEPFGTGSCASMWTIAGNKYASVLPLPVFAMPVRSWPPRTMGKACAWIGRGASIPMPASASITYSGKISKSSKDAIKAYALPTLPSTVTSISALASSIRANCSSSISGGGSMNSRWKGGAFFGAAAILCCTAFCPGPMAFPEAAAILAAATAADFWRPEVFCIATDPFAKIGFFFGGSGTGTSFSSSSTLSSSASLSVSSSASSSSSTSPPAPKSVLSSTLRSSLIIPRAPRDRFSSTSMSPSTSEDHASAPSRSAKVFTLHSEPSQLATGVSAASDLLGRSFRNAVRMSSSGDGAVPTFAAPPFRAPFSLACTFAAALAVGLHAGVDAPAAWRFASCAFCGICRFPAIAATLRTLPAGTAAADVLRPSACARTARWVS